MQQSGLEFFPLAGDPRVLSADMVQTGGRLLPLSREELQAVPGKQQMLEAIMQSTLPACIEQVDGAEDENEPTMSASQDGIDGDGGGSSGNGMETNSGQERANGTPESSRVLAPGSSGGGMLSSSSSSPPSAR